MEFTFIIVKEIRSFLKKSQIPSVLFRRDSRRTARGLVGFALIYERRSSSVVMLGLGGYGSDLAEKVA